MNQAFKPDTLSIVIEEALPHAPEAIWKALTDGDLIPRWMMAPTGFAPVVGRRFTFQTKPAGGWDGVIHCEVPEVAPLERPSYSWKGGHESNQGYGSRLETVVTFTLAKVEAGTQLRMVHAGFTVPKSDTAYRNMTEGWRKAARSRRETEGGTARGALAEAGHSLSAAPRQAPKPPSIECVAPVTKLASGPAS
jgi:uncharacterized protein YndB with AHSA1/START domain